MNKQLLVIINPCFYKLLIGWRPYLKYWCYFLRPNSQSNDLCIYTLIPNIFGPSSRIMVFGEVEFDHQIWNFCNELEAKLWRA